MAEISIDDERYEVVGHPNECPRCHKGIAPIPRNGGTAVSHLFQAIYKCPACEELFFCWFTYRMERGVHVPQRTEPVSPVQEDFLELGEVSPNFVKIFNEAAACESLGMVSVAGLAYRKSLEFLIKDFCIAESPEQSDAIKSEFLGTVIRTRVSDKKIMMAAEKATWLGNDEAHYVRVWLNHDLADLKKLIRLVVSGVTEALQYAAYMKTFETRPVVGQLEDDDTTPDVHLSGRGKDTRVGGAGRGRQHVGG